MARQPSYQDVLPIRDLVTEEEAWEAKQWLDTIADEWAEAMADHSRAQSRIKMAEAAGIMVSSEKSAIRQQADARTTPHYVRAVEAAYVAEKRREKLFVQRAAKDLICRLFQTIRADKRERGIPDQERR